jgi:DNA-binding beta-propeller fold protein YncE
MNARWGCLCLLLVSLAGAGCGSSNASNVTLAISPTSATVLLGTSLQFVPSETGSSNAITWSVNGVVNGNATVGTISSTGLYTAPATQPVQASPIPVPIIFAAANASVPNSGSTGSVIELQSGFDFTNYAVGNTINISGNSVAGWDGSFVIQASGLLQNGNFGVQIATPAGPPANGTGGTATATPNITITAQVQSTNAIASATITLDSGIRVAFAQPSCSIGTNETFSFAPFVSVSGAPSGSQGVSWSLTGVGSIDPNSGLYTAPSTTGTATITATSLADPTETATATVTVVTATDPTISSVSPPNGALGAAFLNVYLSGSNFICTTGVSVNNSPVPTGNVFALSSSSLLVEVPDSVLSTLPTPPATNVTLTFTVQRENGVPQPCSPSPCQVFLSPVRPAIVGATPDSVQQPTTGTPTFAVNIDGGYFGTTSTTAGFSGNPVVSVQLNGSVALQPQFITDRQMSLSIPAGDFAAPGLYPITVSNVVTGSANGSMAALNLAVQPPTSFTPSQIGSAIGVGTTPSSVAINTATGVAVVANQGSNNVTILSLGTLASPSLSVATASLCTGSLSNSPPCPLSGPTSVAIDNLRNLALVANNANSTPSATLAVIDLSVPTVKALLSFPSADLNGNPLPLAPIAVGINPVTGRALVAFTTPGPNGSNVGAILDMNQLQTTTGSVAWPPAVIGSVNINNGVTPHIAVSPRLNWALANPGGAGSLSIVDLGRQTTNLITSVSRNAAGANIVAVDTSVPPALQVGQPVLISEVADSSFDGIFSVTAVSNVGFQYEQAGRTTTSTGGTAAYSNPVASIATNLNVRGVSINDETQKALLADPTSGVPAFVFNILDQTSSLVNNLPQTSNNVATAISPLTNVGVIVNSTANQGYLVNPVSPTAFPTSFTTGTKPVDVAIDPAANTALVVNQSDNTVSLFSLGTLRSAPAIIQSSFAPAGTTQAARGVTITSSLTSSGAAPNQTMTLIGNFPGSPVPRLDASTAPFSGVSVSNGGRVMTATLSGATIAGNGPRQYDLDVHDTSGSTFSNAGRLQVIQAVSLISNDCSNPAPQGVAIDATHDVAVVTEPGCNFSNAGSVAMVSLSSSSGFAVGTGFGATPELAVGANPQGIAVYPQAGLAVAANMGSNSVSIVDIVNDAVPTTFSTDPLPDGVAVDLGLGEAVLSANGASVVDVFPVTTTAQTPTTIGVQRGPSGVAIDQINHVAVVANSTSNNASILDLSSNTDTNTSGSISFPQGVAFDPVSDNFLITSSANNQVVALNPNSVASTALRVGIDPSSIAYNFESGTMVTANNLSGTITVVDFINQTVRGVFSLPSSTQFAVDIHPQTNLAVVADTVDNQLLLVPLPY